MTATGESLMEVVRVCMVNASRVNPESPHRKLLRQLVRWNELELGEALLLLDRIAHEPETFALRPTSDVVREARAAVAPFWERVPA